MPRRFWPPSQIGRAARRQRAGPVGGVRQRHERVGPGDPWRLSGLVGEQGPDDPERGLEPVEALGDRREGDPERAVLRLEPAGAETRDEVAAGDVVEDRQLLGEHRRMAERRRQDADAEPLAGHVVGEGRGDRQCLEARARRGRRRHW